VTKFYKKMFVKFELNVSNSMFTTFFISFINSAVTFAVKK